MKKAEHFYFQQIVKTLKKAERSYFQQIVKNLRNRVRLPCSMFKG